MSIKENQGQHPKMETRKNLFFVLGEWWAARETPARTSGMASRLIRWLLPNGGTLLVVLVLLATVNVWARPLAAPQDGGEMPVTMNYQGRLADNAGAPLNTTVGMRFTIYDALTGGNVMWGPEIYDTVTVQDGLFDVALGSQSPLSPALWNGDRYLEISVAGQVLAPRELIRSVPYAQMAGMALTAATVSEGSLDSRHVQLEVNRVVANIPGDAYRVQLTDAYQAIPGTIVTVTPETAQTYLVYIVAGIRAVGSRADAVLFVDGIQSQQRGSAFYESDDDDLSTVSQVYSVNLEPGTHTLEIRAKRSTSSGTNYIYEDLTTLAYIAVSQ